jgi:ABC-type phosphate transport system substrate-binding protein
LNRDRKGAAGNVQIKDLFMTFPKLAFLTVTAAAVLQAGEVKIIANPSVGASDISSDDLKRVFLATKSSLSDGSHFEPVLEKGGAAHQAFLKEYLGKTDAALGTYYRSLVFTGKGASDAEVVSYVAKTKGAVGYVAAAAPTAGVKQLEIK